MLGVFQINIHKYGESQENQHGQKILTAEQLGKISILQGLKYARTTLYPNGNEHSHKSCGNVVEHKCKKRLVRSEVRFEYSRQNAPYRACDNACNGHDRYEQGVGNFASEVEHTKDSRKTTDKYLSVTSEVPELHLKCGNKCDCHAEKECRVLQKQPDSAL